MPIHPSTLIRDFEGTPIVPEWLRTQLQRDHPGIGVFYQKASWVVTEAWKENDPRRARIQAGDMDPRFAFDICCSLPVTIAPSEVPGLLSRYLRETSATTFTQLRDAVTKWNYGTGEGQDKEAEELVVDQTMGTLGQAPGVSAGVFTTGGFEDETTAAKQKPDFDLSNVPNSATTSPAVLDALKKAREVKAEKRRLAAEQAAAEPAGV